jgi:hypothetical protein
MVLRKRLHLKAYKLSIVQHLEREGKAPLGWTSSSVVLTNKSSDFDLENQEYCRRG